MPEHSDIKPGPKISCDPSDDPKSYKVGDKHPPPQSRFKPGASGNPNGRPKGRRNFKTDLIAELEEPINVRENGRDISVSKQQAVIKSLIDNAIKGDVRAATALSALVERMVGNDANSDHGNSNDEDQKLVDDYIEREVSRRLAMNTPAKD